MNIIIDQKVYRKMVQSDWLMSPYVWLHLQKHNETNLEFLS